MQTIRVEQLPVHLQRRRAYQREIELDELAFLKLLFY